MGGGRVEREVKCKRDRDGADLTICLKSQRPDVSSRAREPEEQLTCKARLQSSRLSLLNKSRGALTGATRSGTYEAECAADAGVGVGITCV